MNRSGQRLHITIFQMQSYRGSATPEEYTLATSRSLIFASGKTTVAKSDVVYSRRQLR